MTQGLRRYQHCRDLHFITFSCYHRLPYLGTAASRDLFESALETVRVRYRMAVPGYVVMPEHVHMLVNEPGMSSLDRAIAALKLSVARRDGRSPFWQARYYDFNVWSAAKNAEKLHYIHQNPVRRGLVTEPSDWKWSSFYHYQTGAEGPVEIESFWTGWKREGLSVARVSQSG